MQTKYDPVRWTSGPRHLLLYPHNELEGKNAFYLSSIYLSVCLSSIYPIWEETYCKELVYAFITVRKSQDMRSSGRPRDADGGNSHPILKV